VNPPAHPDIPLVLAGFGLPPATPAVAVPGGHVNLSFRLPAAAGRFLLQRLNPLVFGDGEAVLRNGAALAAHLARQARDDGLRTPERRVARQHQAVSGAPGVQAPDGAWWRLQDWIDEARAVEQVTAPEQAHQVGVGFGRFLRWMSHYTGPPLVPAIAGFHDTGVSLARFEAAVGRDAVGRAEAVRPEIARCRELSPLAAALPVQRLPTRLIHADAKAGNLLLDDASGEALAVIDLDTAMPGTLLVDVGDLIRSVSCGVAEDDPAPGSAFLREDLFEALLRGFAAGLGSLRLDPLERELMVTAGQVISYEQALRFLTDYLEGDRYYRTTRPGHNLHRTRVQLGLVTALQQAAPRLRRVVSAALD